MIRVLIVDDSMFMRGAIAKVLNATGQFEVAGQARDGHEALAKVLALKPDVVSMDFNMPGGWTGADAIAQIMAQRPTPIVMFSAHTTRGAKETLDALAAGAVDFVTKPAGEVSADLSKVQEELVRKLTFAAQSKPRAMARPSGGPVSGSPGSAGSSSGAPSSIRGVALGQRAPLSSRDPRPSSPGAAPPGGARPSLGGSLPKLVVIAVSTGGPVALSHVIPALPADTRFAVVVVQHMPAHFTAALAERLDGESHLSVREAQDGDRPRPGLVLIAPGDRHLEFDDRGAVVLRDGPHVNGCRPAADVTMLSAARVYGRRTIGVVLTGMGRDGTAGALAIRRAEGRTLAQDEETSVIFGMPRAAIEAGAIEEVAPLKEIASRLRYL
ncbi:MAG: chemotaxis response regulator protein-glutamate methylesterase [Polyangiaceae bacterium]